MSTLYDWSSLKSVIHISVEHVTRLQAVSGYCSTHLYMFQV